MIPAPYNLLLQTASRDNILTLTTACSTSCIFCSHRQNPPDIEAYSVNGLSCEEALEIAGFLDKNSKIVIGESATRICEGEPFLYPGILPVLKGIREKYRNTPIQITTSGVPLTEKMLQELQELGNVELNVSLNSSTCRGRSILYGGKPHMQAVEIVKALAGHNIVFNGSIVAMPHLVGVEDIKETVEFLSGCGAALVRIFIPGYTRYSKIEPPSEEDIHILEALVPEMRRYIKTPITIEPEAISGLEARVEGVAAASAAHRAGMRIGDVITGVNGEAVFSRVDAYYKLFNARNPEVKYLREDQETAVVLQKPKKASAGLVFNYDIHPDTISHIQRVLSRNEGIRRMILTSELAYKIICECIEQSDTIKIEAIENRFFGGNIRCAGLLTVEDAVRHLKSCSFRPQLALLPAIMFDRRGRDLTGRSCDEITAATGVAVEII